MFDENGSDFRFEESDMFRVGGRCWFGSIGILLGEGCLQEQSEGSDRKKGGEGVMHRSQGGAFFGGRVVWGRAGHRAWVPVAQS